MEHQNWETYIIHTKNPKKEKEKKVNKPINQGQKLDKKIEEGDLKHKKIDAELSKKIQQARLSKNLTQKQLAQKLSIPPQTINEIETGKYIYNGQVISKIKRTLNIK
tara:strand:- start:707 stop:1027 length:321 start_codon:yes stop_codon:yes gene_type:complete